MNDQTEFAPGERRASGGGFATRAYRYRTLLLKRWWVILICLGLALSGAAAYLRFAPPEFNSVGQMIVSIKLNLKEGSLYSEDVANFLGTQSALMQGSEVLARASDHVSAQNPNLPAVAKLPMLKVVIVPKTSIFTLTATGENPDYTKAFLQAVMEEYIELKKQMVTRTSDTTSAGLTEQMMRLEPEMQKCDEEIQSFLSTNDAALLSEANGMANYVVSLYQQLAGAQAEQDLLSSLTIDQSIMLEQNQSPVMSASSDTASVAGAAGRMANDVLVTEGVGGVHGPGPASSIGSQYLYVRQQLELLNADRDRYAIILKPKHPQMIALDQRIAELTNTLAIYRQQNVEQLDARKSALALQIHNLEIQTKQQSQVNLELTRKAAQYARLQAKSQRVQSLYEQLLAMLQTVDVNKEISPESVTIYAPASDAFRDKNLTSKTLTMAAVIGLGLGLGILALLDRMDDRMSTFTELQGLFDEDILGQIPRERKPKKGGAVPPLSQDDDRHPFVEAYRNLRSSLLYMSQQEPRPRSLLVTSSVPGDGKSLTATNLAITLALGGGRVLLVDADLRKGNLHYRLNLQNEIGFSEVFLNGTGWRTTVLATAFPNLYLLPRGTTTQRSSEFFIGPLMEKFLQETKAEYDYVVIDSAPVMAADDVTSLAPRMDGVIFVIRAEHTSARVAHSALNMLYQRKAHVLGLVFNSVNVNSGDYYYYYRYQNYKA
jgi:capsular exopolysaccharide synthesis family protein